MTPATLITPELTSTDRYPAGIQWTSPTGPRRAVYRPLIHESLQISVGWQVQFLAAGLGGEQWITDPTCVCPALLVTDDSYRRLSDMAVVPASEATDAEGVVLPGYISEYDFFVQAFGLKTIDVPFGIYGFVADALCRKINQLYGLDLVLQ